MLPASAVGAAAGGRERKARRLQPLRQIGRQRNALGRAGGIVDDDGLVAGTFGRVEDQHRADLADRGGAVALVAGQLQDRRLVEIIAAEMLVDVAEHDIVFQKRRRGAAGAGHRKAGIDGVGEIAGVTELMAGGHADAFAVVKVGNSEWLLRRLTPSRAIAAMVGAVVSSTIRDRKPSATNRTTLCGVPAGAWAKAAVATVVAKGVAKANCRNAVPRRRDGRMDSSGARGNWGDRLLAAAHDTCVTCALQHDQACGRPAERLEPKAFGCRSGA